MPCVAAALAHLPEAQVGLPVEARVGLVEQQQLRLVHQREREVELLAGAAGELLDPVGAVALELQLVQQRLLGALPLRLLQPVGLGEELEVLVDGQLLPDHRDLRAVAEALGPLDLAPIAFQRPTTICISVLFPEPFSPTSPTSCPAGPRARRPSAPRSGAGAVASLDGRTSADRERAGLRPGALPRLLQQPSVSQCSPWRPANIPIAAIITPLITTQAATGMRWRRSLRWRQGRWQRRRRLHRSPCASRGLSWLHSPPTPCSARPSLTPSIHSSCRL